MILTHLEEKFDVGMPRLQIDSEAAISSAPAVMDEPVVNEVVVLFSHLKVIEDATIGGRRDALDSRHQEIAISEKLEELVIVIVHREQLTNLRGPRNT
jgi:alanine racemase